MSRETSECPSPVSAPHTDCCSRSRLIDDVLTPEGKRTGHVRCPECGAAPYKGCK